MPSFNDQDSMDWRDINYPPVTTAAEETYSYPSSNYDMYSSPSGENYYLNNISTGKPSPSPVAEQLSSNGCHDTASLKVGSAPAINPVSAPKSQSSNGIIGYSADPGMSRGSYLATKMEFKEEGRSMMSGYGERNHAEILKSMTQAIHSKPTEAVSASKYPGIRVVSGGNECRQAVALPVSDSNGRFLTLVCSEGSLFTQAGLTSRMPTNSILAGGTSPKPVSRPISSVQTFIRIFPVTVQSPTGASSGGLTKPSGEKCQAAQAGPCTALSSQGNASKLIPPPLTTSVRGVLESVMMKPHGSVKAEIASGKIFPSEKNCAAASQVHDAAKYAPLVSQQVKVAESIGKPLQWSSVVATMNRMGKIMPSSTGSEREDDLASGLMRSEAKRGTLSEEDEEERDDCGPDSKRMKTELKPIQAASHSMSVAPNPSDHLRYAMLGQHGGHFLQEAGLRNIGTNQPRQEIVNEQYLHLSESKPLSETTVLPAAARNPATINAVANVPGVSSEAAPTNREPAADISNTEKSQAKSASTVTKYQPALEYHNQHMSASALIDEIIARGVREPSSQKSIPARCPTTMIDDVTENSAHQKVTDTTDRINDESLTRSLNPKSENVQSTNSLEYQSHVNRDHLTHNNHPTTNPSSRHESLPQILESTHRGHGLIRSQSMMESIKLTSPRHTSTRRAHQSKPQRLSLDGAVSTAGPGINGRRLDRRSEGEIPSGGDSSRSRSSGGSSKYMNLRNKSNRRPIEGGGRVRQKRQTARDMVRPLKQWLYAHRDVPYPTRADKLELAVRSNMSLTQVSNWFANARRRLKNTVQELDSNGQPLSWAKRMKLYNSHVVGNQELLSISSESSCSSSCSSWKNEQLQDDGDPHPEDVEGPDIEISYNMSSNGFASPGKRRSNSSSLLATMDSLNRQGNGGAGGAMAAKFKQGILHRYLNDSYDELMRRHQCHDDVDDDVDRRRNASGSLSSHDYEEEVGEEEEEHEEYGRSLTQEGEESRSSSNTVTPKGERNADDNLAALLESQQILRTSAGAPQRVQQDDLYWKEISAAMALTTLARARKAM